MAVLTASCTWTCCVKVFFNFIFMSASSLDHGRVIRVAQYAYFINFTNGDALTACVVLFHQCVQRKYKEHTADNNVALYDTSSDGKFSTVVYLPSAPLIRTAPYLCFCIDLSEDCLWFPLCICLSQRFVQELVAYTVKSNSEGVNIARWLRNACSPFNNIIIDNLEQQQIISAPSPCLRHPHCESDIYFFQQPVAQAHAEDLIGVVQ